MIQSEIERGGKTRNEESKKEQAAAETCSQPPPVCKIERNENYNILPAKVGITSLILNILGLALLTELFFSADTACKLLGIALYVIGIIGMAISPLIYKKVFDYLKKENAYDVVELAKEIQ